IPPGEKDYQISDALVVPAEIDVLSLFPHAHYLATKLRVWAELPSGKSQELLRIDDWDFKWQDQYTFASPVHLPAGSVLKMQFSYDNSADNTHNPSKPPVRVTTGEGSKNEMGNVTLQVAPVRQGDLELLREVKFRRELRLNDGALAHYNLANTLSRTGRTAEAIEHYEAALARQPDFESAHYNLAGVLLGLGRYQDAIPHLRKVIALRPESAPAYVHLGRALIALGKREEGLVLLRRAVELDPHDAAARNVLADAEAAAAP
ncbi:MAG: tetratricopeptide repeat protein, partial [Polyangiales bacterium]